MKVKKNHRKRKQMKTLLELIADLLSCFNHCTDDGLKDDASNNTPGSVSNNWSVKLLNLVYFGV